VNAIGTFSHESRSGNLVIRGDEVQTPTVPAIYSYAQTNKSKVGKIRDVIGPAKRPYIIVKPTKKLTKKEISSLTGKTFFEIRRSHAKTRRNSTGKKGRVY